MIKEMQLQISSYTKNEKAKQKINKALEILIDTDNGKLIKDNISIASMLMQYQGDWQIIIVALIRNIDLTESQKDLFDEKIFELESNVKALNRLENISIEENNYEDFRNVLVLISKDYRVLVLELCRVLNVMREFKKTKFARRQTIADLALHIYAPIAHRLGLNDLKTEIEELSLYYLNHEVYKEIAKGVELKKEERELLINEMINDLNQLIGNSYQNLEIHGRSKSIYSIYKKAYLRGKSLDKLFDLQAIRIICDDKIACYTILGLIHEKYPPLDGRFKDYIARKKPNLYQSLHTSVVGSGDKIFEIQIRTHKMDEIAERGIAAHWKYKEGENNQNSDDAEEKLHLFRDVITDEGTVSNLNDINAEVFNSYIYALTPNGKVVHLPKNASVIDFAYRIHSNVAQSITGAIVNKQIVSYDYELQNGDIVEILTKKGFEAPNNEWLEYAKSSKNRRKIRAYIRKKQEREREFEISRGREILISALKKEGFTEKIMEDEGLRDRILSHFSYKRNGSFLYAIGTKELHTSRVVEFLKPKEQEYSFSKRSNKPNEKVVILGGKGIARQLAKCCMPVKDDDIVGVIATGVGIKVHRVECKNIIDQQNLKTIDVFWSEEDDNAYRSEIRAIAEDLDNLLHETVTALNKTNIPVENFGSRVKGKNVNISLTVIVKNQEEIKYICDILMQIRGILYVKRCLK